MTVVVVEDEARVLNFICEALRHEGYNTYSCSGLDEATIALSSLGKNVDILVMDRLLGPSDAVSLIPVAKENCPQAKILVLSAMNEPAQKAATLDLGADDYLGKPFQLVELSARIRSLIRRQSEARSPHQQAASHVYNLGNLRLSALDRKVLVGSKSIDLSNKEYLLLLTLIQHPGRVFNKFQLLDRVWDTQFEVESNVVEVTIKNLRRKLEANNCEARVMSRRNIGYWLEA